MPNFLPKLRHTLCTTTAVILLVHLPMQRPLQAATMPHTTATTVVSHRAVAPAPSAIALAIEAELQPSLQQSFQSGVLPALLNNKENRDSTAYWTNALYASGGSAAGNALVLAIFIGLEIVPPFLGAGNLAEAGGPLLAPLVLIPAITTPLFMHLWSPAAENNWQAWLWSGGSSLISTLLHLALMTSIALSYNQFTEHTGSFTENFYLFAPMGMISAVFVESLATAQGHQYATRLEVVQAPGNGLMLSQQVLF